MKQTALSITLSAVFLVLGVVSLYQSSNPNFISKADIVNESSFDVSTLMVIIGIVLVLLSAITIYIQYLTIIKREK